MIYTSYIKAHVYAWYKKAAGFNQKPCAHLVVLIAGGCHLVVHRRHLASHLPPYPHRVPKASKTLSALRSRPLKPVPNGFRPRNACETPFSLGLARCCGISGRNAGRSWAGWADRRGCRPSRAQPGHTYSPRGLLGTSSGSRIARFPSRFKAKHGE